MPTLKSSQLQYLFRPAIFIMLLDQVTKLLVLSNIRTKSVAILPHINFHLAYNRGAAFGILAAAGGWQRWVFVSIAIIISLIIVLWSMRLNKKDRLEVIALGLILGGAWGNLFDRMRFGHVIDFIDFYIGNWHWYTFNVADIAICVGAALLALLSLRKG